MNALPLLAQFYARFGPVEWIIIFCCGLALCGCVYAFVTYMEIPIPAPVWKFLRFLAFIVGIVLALLVVVWAIRMIAGQM